MAKTATSASVDASASPFSAEFLEEMLQLLTEERKKIVAFYQHDMAAGKGHHQEDPEDFADRANMSYNRDLMFSLSDAEQKQLEEIDAALGRLEAGSFGICMYSGKPIAEERLRAVPWTRYRVEYQEMAEKGILGDDG